MSTFSQLSWIYRRAICTGESMNMVRRLSVPRNGLLIPAAISAEQRNFEAGFLLSWAEATDFVSARQGSPVPSFLSATHPAPDCLAITVSHPTTLVPLLRLVLPRWVNDRVVGTPGLRVYLWRDFLELRMLGAENDVRARIRLYGVNRSRHQAKELLAQAVRSWPAHRPLYMERTVLPGELSAVRAPATWLDSLLSDLLRRFPLWRTADLVSISRTVGTASVRWHGSPSAATILAVLGSPSCGVPYGGTGLPSFDDGYEIVFSGDSESERRAAEPWEAWEAVHTAQVVHPRRVAVAPRGRTRVVPEAWEDSDMRDALAAREISTIYRLLRRRGVSQRQIAAMTGQSQSEVSEILKGRQVMAYDVLVRIADGLGVPRGYMGLAYDEVVPARVVSVPADEEPEVVKRRKFLAHAAAVAAGGHVLGADSGSWVSGPVLTPAPDRIGMTDVRQVEAATRALRSLDYQYGGGFCRDAAAAQTLWVEGLLAKAKGAEIRARLMASIAELDAIGTRVLWLPGDPLPDVRRKGENRG